MATLFVRGGDLDWFTGGSVQPFQYQTVRPLVFNPVITDYRGKIPPGYNGMVAFNFRAGRAVVRVVGSYNNLTLTHSQALQFPNGRLVHLDGPALVGSLTDFSFYPDAAGVDPYNFYVQSATALNSGGVGQAWVRHNAVFAVDRGAKYLAVGAKFTNVPATTVTGYKQYMKAVQVEPAAMGATLPSAYTEAREIRCRVTPTRLNYSVNPCFWVDSSNWTNATRTTRTGTPSGYAGNYTLPSGVGQSTHTIPSLNVGQVYTARVSVAATIDTHVTPSVVSGGTAVNTTPVDAGDGDVTMYITFVATGTSVVLRFSGVSVVTSTVSYWNVVVEKGYTPGPYFDGSTSGDTLWEVGGTAGNTRSYLYLNRADRTAALRRILLDNAPFGIGVAEPEYGVLPR